MLLQVVFHSQMAKERGAFDFDKVVRHLVNKLVRRHPHVFGRVKVKDVDQVWANWERIKRAEKDGTKHARPSALDGIPKHLPALMRAEKLLKKARRAKLVDAAHKDAKGSSRNSPGFKPGAEYNLTRSQLGAAFFGLARYAQRQGWSAEELLRAETHRQEKAWRKQERAKA